MDKKVPKNKKKNTNQKTCESTTYRKPHISEKDILNNLLEVIPDSIYFKDKQSRVIILSKYLLKEKLDMSTTDEAIGKTDFDFFSEEHARQAFEDEQNIIRTGQPIIGIEEKETWPDKPDAWVITTKMPLRDSKGKIIGTFGISRDITRRKQAEIELVKYKEHLSEDQAPLDTPTLVHSLDNLVNRLSTSHGKQVSFKYDGFDENIIPYSKRLVIKDVLVQLVRNSVYHGIETPQERESLGKPSSGTIEISTFMEGSKLGISFRDDGRGLSLEELRQKARDSGQWIQTDIDCWTDKQVMETIFLPGISTAKSKSITGGRGVDLDVVKKKIEAHNGIISVASSPGQFCEFTFILRLPKVRIKKKTRAPRKSKKETESISVS